MEPLPFDHLPFIDRVKIQSEILLPLYRRLREELGTERANELVRASVREYGLAFGRGVAASEGATSIDKLGNAAPVFAAKDAIDMDIIAVSQDEFTFNITACQYAEYFQALGEPEFGAMLTCEVDPIMTEAISSDLTLSRTQTRMANASHCDFSWKVAHTDGESA